MRRVNDERDSLKKDIENWRRKEREASDKIKDAENNGFKIAQEK